MLEVWARVREGENLSYEESYGYVDVMDLDEESFRFYVLAKLQKNFPKIFGDEEDSVEYHELRIKVLR